MQYSHLGRPGLSVPVCIWAPRISVHSPMIRLPTPSWTSPKRRGPISLTWPTGWMRSPPGTRPRPRTTRCNTHGPLRRHSFRRHRPEGLVHRRIRGHQRRCSRTGGRRRAPTDHAEPRHRNPAPPLRKTRRCSGPTYGIRRRCVPRSVAGRSTWSWTLLPSQRITWLRTLSYSPAGQGSTSSSAPPPRTRNPLRGCRFWNQHPCGTRFGSTRGKRSPSRICWSRPTARMASPPRSSDPPTPMTRP
jgi:hypothetical protein